MDGIGVHKYVINWRRGRGRREEGKEEEGGEGERGGETVKRNTYNPSCSFNHLHVHVFTCILNCFHEYVRIDIRVN